VPRIGVDGEFVVAAADVLDERMSGGDHSCAAEGTIALRRRASSPCTKQEGKTPQAPWKTPINRTSEGLSLASGRASGAGPVSRSLNATVPWRVLGVGIDWAEAFHDIALGTAEKGVIQQFRIEHSPAGIERLIMRCLALEPDPAPDSGGAGDPARVAGRGAGRCRVHRGAGQPGPGRAAPRAGHRRSFGVVAAWSVSTSLMLRSSRR
jgi:hypothetical protein